MTQIFKKSTALLLAFFLLAQPAYPAVQEFKKVADGGLRALAASESSRHSGNLHADGTRVGSSGIKIANAPLLSDRVEITRFRLKDYGIHARCKVSHSFRQLSSENFHRYKTIMGIMRNILSKKTTSVYDPDREASVITAFVDMAHAEIQRILRPLAATYEMDPYTSIVLEWGSRKAAHYYRKGRYGHEIVVNINLLGAEQILQGELLHEALHPVVNSWLTYLPIDRPNLLENCGIDITHQIKEPLKEGYMLHRMKLPFMCDNIDILADCAKTLLSSGNADMARVIYSEMRDIALSNKRMQEQAERALEMDLDGAIVAHLNAFGRALAPIQSEEHVDLNADAIDNMARLLRESLDLLETLPLASCHMKAWEVRKQLSNNTERTLRDMSEVENNDIIRKTAELKEGLRGRAVLQALGEVFILSRELQYFRNTDPEGAAVALKDPNNPLDDEGCFAALLRLSASERLAGIINLVAKPGMYASNPDLTEGAVILKETYGTPTGLRVIEEAFRELDKRVDAMNIIPNIRTPMDLGCLLDIIETRNVDFLRVRIVDPSGGSLQGQIKTVLISPNEQTPGLLQEGIPFDGSSIQHSLSGAPLGEIGASDKCARIMPETLVLRKNGEGKIIATVDAEVIDPAINTPLPLSRQHNLSRALLNRDTRNKLTDPGTSEAEAQAIAIRELSRFSIDEIKIQLDTWFDAGGDIPIRVNDLGDAFNQGVAIPSYLAIDLPAEGPKDHLKAWPDARSLILRKGPDGSVHATMACRVTYENGRDFEGDYRTKLLKLEEELAKIGIGVLFAPEPEVYYAELIPYTHEFQTADISGYYTDILGVPTRLQRTHLGVVTAANSAGIPIFYAHNEVGLAQAEYPRRHSNPVNVADASGALNQINTESAEYNGLKATFVPKPIEGDNGSGSHVHMSLFALRDGVTIGGKTYSKGDNIFYDEEEGLSLAAQYCMGGLIRYGPHILPLTNPSANSYLRLGANEAPGTFAIGRMNRTAGIRIPMFTSKRACRVEYRMPDGSSKFLYRTFYGILAALKEGIDRQITPAAGQYVEELSLYGMTHGVREERGIKSVPTGPNALETAINWMNVSPEEDSDAADFINRILGPPGTPGRDFLTNMHPFKYELQQITQTRPGSSMRRRGGTAGSAATLRALTESI